MGGVAGLMWSGPAPVLLQTCADGGLVAGGAEGFLETVRRKESEQPDLMCSECLSR